LKSVNNKNIRQYKKRQNRRYQSLNGLFRRHLQKHFIGLFMFYKALTVIGFLGLNNRTKFYRTRFKKAKNRAAYGIRYFRTRLCIRMNIREY
jgi:hypothetical protein